MTRESIRGSHHRHRFLLHCSKANFSLRINLLLTGFADVNLITLEQFKFTPESENSLQLLYLNGFKFPDNFEAICRPSNVDHELQFAEFCSWLKHESSNVRSLQELTRISYTELRMSYKKQLPKIIEHLPNKLKIFLLFK